MKCYRNIQDLFNEFDSKIEKMGRDGAGVGSVKGYVKCLSWFAILNFVVLIGFILYSLGVFNFLALRNRRSYEYRIKENVGRGA